MSRNNKNARLHAEARSWGKIRKEGGKGPARTEKKHTKKNLKRLTKEAIEARKAILMRSVDKRTVLEKLKETEA